MVSKSLKPIEIFKDVFTCYADITASFSYRFKCFSCMWALSGEHSPLVARGSGLLSGGQSLDPLLPSAWMGASIM